MGIIPTRRLSRRQYLAATGAVLTASVAGCSGGREPATVTVDVAASRGDSTAQLWENDEASLEPGEYYFWEFTLESEHDVEYAAEVTEGGPVDVYLMEDAELQKLQDGEDFSVITDAAWQDIQSASDTVTLGQGTYWLVVMNADLEPENL